MSFLTILILLAMSKVCQVCGKGPTTGHNVSHSVRRTKRRFKANIQNKKFNVGGQMVKFKVATSALRTMVKPNRKARKALKELA